MFKHSTREIQICKTVPMHPSNVSNLRPSVLITAGQKIVTACQKRTKSVLFDRNNLKVTHSPEINQRCRAVSFFELFTDNMILQRDDHVAVYGRTSATQEVTVTFADQTKTATAVQDGNWSLTLDPMAASFTPRTLTATTVEGSVSVTNVLVGDVWLASGQSNMDNPFTTFTQISTAGRDNPNIRLLIGSWAASATPQEKPVLSLAHRSGVQHGLSGIVFRYSLFFRGASANQSEHSDRTD